MPGTNCTAERPDQRQPLAAVAIASRRVHLVASAHPLGLVHRDVRALQQPDPVGGVVGEQRDADARVHLNRYVPDLKRTLQRGAQTQRGGARPGLVARLQRHRELVTTQWASRSSSRSNPRKRGPICRKTSSPA